MLTLTQHVQFESHWCEYNQLYCSTEESGWFCPTGMSTDNTKCRNGDDVSEAEVHLMQAKAKNFRCSIFSFLMSTAECPPGPHMGPM